MNRISLAEAYDLFITTIDRLNETHLKKPDRDLLYIILEELDIEAISFLHNENVERLICNNLVPKEIAEDVKSLRNTVLLLIENKNNVHQIRNDDEWKNARLLANDIYNRVVTFQSNNNNFN